MGIYGALSTAVTGLRAQSFSLENISGNIANSQTTGFKRLDTDFVDLIPDAALKRQTAGSVLAQSRATNSLQGDIKIASTETYMAINGDGFFVVEPKIGQADGGAIFAGNNLYTRRGDFELDKGGYLVNGSGMYLKGLPIDPSTQNISGSVPQVLRLSNAFLPAANTTQVNYELNLPQLPKTARYQDEQTPGSELLTPSNFMNVPNDVAAVRTGTATIASLSGLTTAQATGAATTALAAASTLALPTETLNITVGGANRTYTFATGGASAGLTIHTDDVNTDTVAELLAYIEADLQANGAPDATVALDNGRIRVSAGNTTDSVSVTDATTGFDFTNGTTPSSFLAGNAAARLADAGDTIQIAIGSTTRTYTFATAGGTSGTTIDMNASTSDTIAEVLAHIQADLRAQGATNALVSLVNGEIQISAGNNAAAVTVADNTNGFGIGTATASPTLAGTDDSSRLADAGESLSITVGSTSRTYSFTTSGGTSGTTIDLTAGTTNTVAEVLAYIQADLQAQGATGTQVSLSGGNVSITAGNFNADVSVINSTSGFGLANGTSEPSILQSTQLAARVTTISADDASTFVDQSIAGGAITVYAENGAPANVQMRWAKVNSAAMGGADRWNLFILTDSTATGTQPAWTRVGGDYTFGPNGAPSPAVDNTDLSNLTVNGVEIGNVRLQHGSNGLTQFADPNGTAEVTTLNQNGYAAGEFVSVAVNDSGRVVVSYNNGKQLEVAQVITANFNAANQLKRTDGGVFEATSESGEPIFDTDGGVVGSSLEASNTDISEEFTKLIVTQQAYAAGTRIVSTADEMLQEALNMVR